MHDLKELGVLLLGFVPWLLFLFLSGHTLESLEISILASLCIIATGLTFTTLYKRQKRLQRERAASNQ